MSEKLKKLLSSWCSPTLMVDLRLILKAEAIQPLCLNAQSYLGLAQGAFLMPKALCRTIIQRRVMHCWPTSHD